MKASAMVEYHLHMAKKCECDRLFCDATLNGKMICHLCLHEYLQMEDYDISNKQYTET